MAPDIEQVRSEVAKSRVDSLLDVGGGTGAVTQALSTGISRVAVVEPDASKRARGARRRPRIEFLAGDAAKLPVPEGTFDLVVAFVAFHHFPDQPAALLEMRRVMRPDGRLILFEFRPENAPGPFWRLFAGHTHFVEAETLATLVGAAGFVGTQAAPTPSGYFVVARKGAHTKFVT